MMHSTQNYWGYGHIGVSPLGLGIFAVIGGLWFLCVIALKGYSLWHAAQRKEKWWFIFMLVLNTAGILEIAYITFVLQKFSKHAHRAHHDHTTKTS